MLALIREQTKKRTQSLGASVSVGDLMTRPQPIVPSHLSMAAARKIARLKSADALIVEDKGCLVGILDSQSLRDADDDQTIAECLRPLQFCLTPTTTMEQARALLIKSGAASLPVAAGPFLVGSVSRAAVERSLAAGVLSATTARMAA